MRFAWCFLVLAACAPSETRVETPPPAPQPQVAADSSPPATPTPSGAGSSSSTITSRDSLGVVEETSVTAGLIDSKEVEEMTSSHTEAKVEVWTGQKADTIPNLVVAKAPGVTRDGVVYGVSITSDGTVGKAYQYDAKTRQLSFVALPKDVNDWNSDITVSPDGRHVAYIGNDSAGIFGVVRDWPGMTLVLRTPPVKPYPSDYYTDQANWIDAARFEFFIRTPGGVDSTNHMISKFVVARGDVRVRSMTVDTLATRPELSN
jgi:WD40 repeat protein